MNTFPPELILQILRFASQANPKFIFTARLISAKYRELSSKILAEAEQIPKFKEAEKSIFFRVFDPKYTTKIEINNPNQATINLILQAYPNLKSLCLKDDRNLIFEEENDPCFIMNRLNKEITVEQKHDSIQRIDINTQVGYFNYRQFFSAFPNLNTLSVHNSVISGIENIPKLDNFILMPQIEPFPLNTKYQFSHLTISQIVPIFYSYTDLSCVTTLLLHTSTIYQIGRIFPNIKRLGLINYGHYGYQKTCSFADIKDLDVLTISSSYISSNIFHLIKISKKVDMTNCTINKNDLMMSGLSHLKISSSTLMLCG